MILNNLQYPPTTYSIGNMTYTDNTSSAIYPSSQSVQYIPTSAAITQINDYDSVYGNVFSTISSQEIILKGEKLSDIISEIRDGLGFIKRDRMREEKYSELKALAEEYSKILTRIRAMEAVVGEENIE